MAQIVNIRRDVSDKFYRYKMPKLISKVEGKGNGIRTVIPNMSDIAKSLSRPSTYPAKFFGCELGAQVKCDEKNGKYIVNGAHHADKLQQLLDGFIEKFVLCPSCRNPETDLMVVNKNEILRNCRACGAVHSVDMRHKLCTWIFKNPPMQYNEIATQGKKKNSLRLDSKKITPNSGSTVEKIPSTSTSALVDVGLSGSYLLDVDASDSLFMNPPYVDDDTDNEIDTYSGGGNRIHKAKSTSVLSTAMDKLTINVNSSMDKEAESLEEFGIFLSGTPDVSHEDIISRAANLRSDKVSAILPQVLFTKRVMEDSEVKRWQPLIKNFVKNEKTQRSFLGGMERFVGIRAPELIPKISIIFKELYDHDIIDEEAFLSWGEKPTGRYVDKGLSREIHSRASAFINWLEDAEEESDQEEE